MSYFLIPIILILVLLVLMGIFVFLARFRNGRYLRPLIMWLSKVPWLRKQFEKVSQAAIEREKPELASAMRKLQRAGPNPDMKKLQQAYQSLTPDERRAYQELADEQQASGAAAEPANRQMRRAQQRMAQANRAPRSGQQKPNNKKKR